ncbi:hypothetical protein BSF_14990 [Bacillus subtilis]|nr:hypothetical protein BSF_14990 [Bacillus subtilis]
MNDLGYFTYFTQLFVEEWYNKQRNTSGRWSYEKISSTYHFHYFGDDFYYVLGLFILFYRQKPD